MEEKLRQVKQFFLNLPITLKKTIIWLIISYIIPIINILIVWGLKKENFTIDLNISSIILVTNTCFVTAVIHLMYLNDRRREFTNILNIITIIVTVGLFSLSIVQIETKSNFFITEIYKNGAYITLGFSIILGLISKYDEIEIQSIKRAQIAQKTKSTNIGNKEVSL